MRRPPLWGAILLLVLLLFLEYLFLKGQVRSRVKLPPPTQKAPPALGAPPLPRRDLPPLETLTASIEAPIFFEGRELPPEKPPKAEGTPSQPQRSPTPPNLELIAVIEAPQLGRIALLRGEKVVRVRVGDQIGRWRVVAIERERILLEAEGTRHELPLFKERRRAVSPEVKPPVAPVKPPAPPKRLLRSQQ